MQANPPLQKFQGNTILSNEENSSKIKQ